MADTAPSLVLHLNIGGEAVTRHLSAGSPAELAQQVHRHARGHLGSRAVDVHLDPETLTGTIHQHGATVGEFALEPVEESTPAPKPASNPYTLRHGYTSRDIDRMARAACVADRSLAADMTTRYDIAWSAIALALCEADTPPDRQELVRVAWQAIYTEVREVRHLYGIPRDDTDRGVASAVRFRTYWQPTPGTAAEDALVEGIAVHQVLDTLRASCREAVDALADHGTLQAAAGALGIDYKAMARRMQIAKRDFFTAWFAPETPPTTRHFDRRVGAYGRELATHCPAGHEWTPENTRWDKGRGAGYARVRRCRACERVRSAARVAARRSAGARLLEGC